jgi:magnesium transporter
VNSGDAGAAQGPEAVRVRCLRNPEHHEVRAHLKDSQFVWIDYEDPTDDDLSELATLIKLHPLTLEDAQTFRQRPKVEEYEGYMFMVVFGVDPGTAPGGPLLREVHILISGDYLITIHRRPFAPLDDLRLRYHDQKVRSELFLVYQVLNTTIDTFVPVLTRIDDDIDELEQDIIDNADTEDLQRIFSLKRDLVAMRRVVAPMRDMFARNADRIADLPGLESDGRLYIRDLYDGLVRVSELVDSYRDLLSGATDMYLSTVANRQGEINKQLTIIATVFLPLTFLTGFFGQNFATLVSWIRYPWVFFVFGIGLLLVSAVGFRIYFKRKRWI